MSILQAQGVTPPSGVGAKNVQAEAANDSDRKLVAFAKQTVPVIESHIAMDKRDIAALGSAAMSMRMPGEDFRGDHECPGWRRSLPTSRVIHVFHDTGFARFPVQRTYSRLRTPRPR